MNDQQIRIDPAWEPDPVWDSLRRSFRFWVASSLLALLVAMALIPQAFVHFSPATHDPRDCSVRSADGTFQDRLTPSTQHWFGTDIQGCDYYARAIFGARISLLVGIGSALIASAIGLIIGGLGGFFGGWADALTGRIGDIFFALPYLVGAILLLTFVAGENRNAFEVMSVIGLLSWPLAARIARSSTLVARAQDYVEAARALGASRARILIRHVLPNVIAPIAIYTLISIGVNIGVEATLTFLGVGLQSPSLSWGLMISSASSFIYDSPHLLLFPALFVTAAVISFLILGDVIRDATDPRMR
jgi:peptide/nickel transport system permease protein/oligopeptide transport system permease protein